MQAIMIPSSAIQKIKGQPAVFVQEKDGSFAKRQLELGREFGSSVEVKSGLKEGEQVVVRALSRLNRNFSKRASKGTDTDR